MITLVEIKEVLNYDPVTGVFTRKKDRGGSMAGDIVGKISKYNNLMPHIVVKGAQYSQPFLAYFIVNGFKPDGKALRKNAELMPTIDNITVVKRRNEYLKFPKHIVKSSIYFISPCSREAKIINQNETELQVSSRFSPDSEYGHPVWVDKSKFYNYYNPV